MAIDDPLDAATITSPTTVLGTVESDLLSDYTLAFRLQESGQQDEDGWVALYTGNAEVTQGPVGDFDPTLLLNGIYELRLSASDELGRTAHSEIVSVVVEGNQKVGLFTVSFEDLQVPLSGMPIGVVRTYDSRAAKAGQVGDFGVGWTLSLTDVRLQKNRPLGKRWRQEVTGTTFYGTGIYSMTPNTERVVTITMPDNEVFRFRAVFDPAEQSAVPIVGGQVIYEPLPGTHGTLESLDGDGVRCSGNVAYLDTQGGQSVLSGNVELISDNTFDLYEPDTFRFTTAEGLVLVVSEQNGLQSVTDLNGNELVYGPNGVIHSSGESVQFVRDAQGRITSIVDPAGLELTYTYDAAGDLVTFTDRTTNDTTFVYSSGHFLEDIIDPRGVQAIRCLYDAEGRLISQTDADGNVIGFGHDVANRRETITDRLGNVTVHEYDERGNVVQTTDPLGGVTTRTYDAFDNQLTETDPLGHTTTWTYDGNDNQTSETDSAGRTTSTSYDPQNRPTGLTDANGNATQFVYDFRGNLDQLVDALGNATTFDYDTSGNLLRQTDALGNVTEFTYDFLGRQLTRTDALGTVTTMTHDDQGNVLTESVTRTGTNGVEILLTQYAYDAENRLVTTTDPAGGIFRIEYDPAGQEIARIDALGRRTEMFYNDRGELEATEYPDGSLVSMGYDLEGRKVLDTDAAGFATAFEYDPLGRMTKTVFPDGAETETAYDLGGRVLASIDALGNATTYEYENGCSCSGRRTAVTNALGQVSRYVYDDNGNVVLFTDDNGHVMQYEYDTLNRRTRVIFDDGTDQLTTYDALGRRVAQTDQAGQTTWFGYDPLGRLTAVTNALGQVTNYEYDETGNQTAQIDAKGHRTEYAHNALGRRVRRILPGGQTENTVYDLTGNLLARTDFNGRTTQYAYDDLNRLTSKTPDPVFGAPAVSYGYDARGLRTSMSDAHGTTTWTYDSRGRTTQKASPIGTLDYSYDAQGNLLSTDSARLEGVHLNYTHDALNRLKTVSNPNTGLSSYAYDQVGNLASTIYPNGTTHAYQYDSLNRLTQLTAGYLSTPQRQYQYTRAVTGHRLSEVETVAGRQVSWGYDAIYRLTSETISGATASGLTQYTHDVVGNRLSRTTTVPGLANQAYNYDANDRILGDSYDANGNTVAADGNTDEYDFENRLIKRTKSNGDIVEIQYDGDGNRVRKTVNGIPVFFLVDTNNHTGYAQVVEELGTDVSGFVVNVVYTYGHDLISQERWDAGNAVWIAHHFGYDGHGSVRFLTDSTGAVTDTCEYDAFGNLIEQTGATINAYRYTGEQFDEDLGMYFLRARYMDVVRGKFWTMDVFEGNQNDPATLHKYLYVNADPVNRIDPSGYSGITEIVQVSAIIGAISGAVVGGGIGYVKSNGDWVTTLSYAFLGASVGYIGGAQIGALIAGMQGITVGLGSGGTFATIIKVMPKLVSQLARIVSSRSALLAALRFEKYRVAIAFIGGFVAGAATALFTPEEGPTEEIVLGTYSGSHFLDIGVTWTRRVLGTARDFTTPGSFQLVQVFITGYAAGFAFTDALIKE